MSINDTPTPQTRLINVIVRDDGTIRAFTPWVRPGEFKPDDIETTDVLDFLVELHARIENIREQLDSAT